MSFASAGGNGVLIVVVSIVIAFTAGACALFRVRRIAAVAVLLASVLPFGAGLAGVISAQIGSYQTIESLRAPTPADLDPFASQGVACFALGIAGTCLCAVAGVVALARSRREESPEDFPTDED